MSLPACPMCGEHDVPRVDAAAIIRIPPDGSPLRLSVSRLRTYRCRCGTEYRTSETIDTINPEVMWVRKLAVDETKEQIPPTG